MITLERVIRQAGKVAVHGLFMTATRRKGPLWTGPVPVPAAAAGMAVHRALRRLRQAVHLHPEDAGK